MNTETLIDYIDKADAIERECAAEVSRILGEAIDTLGRIADEIDARRA